MGDEKIDYSRINNDWQSHLEIFWKDNFSKNGSKFQTIIDKIGLSITPIAILPFEEYLYAKYIALPKTHQELAEEDYKLLITEKRPIDGTIHIENTPIAPGIYKAICLDAPYMWIKYLKEQEEYRTFDEAKKEIQAIDVQVDRYERSLYNHLMQTATHCANCRESSVAKNEVSKDSNQDFSSVKGHFIVPLFYGTIPVYCVIVTSNILDPNIFKIYYLRETFDMIGRTGEYILEEKFFELWIAFCERYTNDYEPNSETRKSFFNTLIGKLTGVECQRKFSSWIHTIPGHWIEQNERLKHITINFKTKYADVKERLIGDHKWYKQYFKNLIDISNKNKIFKEPHEIRNQTHLNLFKNILDKADKFVHEANKCNWFRDIINEIKDGNNFKKAQMAFYRLKSILNRVDYTNNTIGVGFIFLWPSICNEKKELSLKSQETIEFYKSEVIIKINPFDFTESFYSFVSAFNFDTVKINEISFEAFKEKRKNAIKIICKTTDTIPEEIIKLLNDKDKLDNVENNDGNRYEVSFKLVLLHKTCQITVGKNKGKEIVFKLGGKK